MFSDHSMIFLFTSFVNIILSHLYKVYISCELQGKYYTGNIIQGKCYSGNILSGFKYYLKKSPPKLLVEIHRHLQEY